MTLEDCLPEGLRGPATTITKIAAGLSGAGVHRVESGGKTYVLKLAADSEPIADWHRTLGLQRLAADAGLAPRIVHVDESRRAVVTDFVPDRGFMPYFRNPATHDAALAQLGRTVKRIHALPLPKDAPDREPRGFLKNLWNGLQQGFSVPAFVGDAVGRVLAEPPFERTIVLGHNDLNPTNLVFDGTSIVLLDWAAAGAADTFWDLATLAVFLRLDDAECARLLAAYDEKPAGPLPERFRATRRFVAALAGTMMLVLAKQMKHPGAAGETFDSALPLGDFYRRLMAGELRMGTPDGQWAFGLALARESLSL